MFCGPDCIDDVNSFVSLLPRYYHYYYYTHEQLSYFELKKLHMEMFVISEIIKIGCTK